MANSVAQIAALKKVSSFAEVPEELLAVAISLYEETKNEDVRRAIEQAGQHLSGQELCYRPAEVAPIRELSHLRLTKEYTASQVVDGTLQLRVDVGANGANFIRIQSVNH